MTPRRKIIVDIATSADGYIARPDGDIIPTFIGQGIPLVAPRHRDVPLRLRLARKYPDSVVRLGYEVGRESG